LLLVALIVQVISQIASVPVSVLFGVGTVLFDPTGVFSDQTSILSVVVSVIIAIPVAAVAAVVQSAAVALVYLDLRMRKEGLDLELARYVESVAQGGNAPNPYLVPAPSASGYAAA